jgi:hypothetical protein
MTKTYSEVRQDACFKHAVELYKLVVQIADDNVDCDPTHTSAATIVWAASLIDKTFEQADTLENQGHEEAVATSRQENWLRHHRALAQARTGEGRRLKASAVAAVDLAEAQAINRAAGLDG